MELTKKALEDVKFRTRGRWYNADQVDAFLEELAVSADEADRERQETRSTVRALEEQVDKLRDENVRLWKQVQDLKSRLRPSLKLKTPRELELERDRLIQDIKALKRFREDFQKAVEKDAASLTERLRNMESNKLL